MANASIAAGEPTRPKYGSMSRDRTWALRWSYFFLVLFAIFFLMPPIYMLITSLKTSAEISSLHNPWWVYHPTLSNYVELITSPTFQTFFINSALVATLATGVFLTYLVPDTLLFIPLFKMFAWVNDTFGIQLMNHWWTLIILYPTLTVPFATWIMIGYFASIPKELDEAAIIDGAGPIRLFFRVIFPLLRSVIVTIIVVQSVFVFNDFQNPLYFLPGEKNATVQLTLFNFQSQYDTDYNLLFTTILLITIPPLLMYIFFNRRIVAGLTGGAVKG